MLPPSPERSCPRAGRIRAIVSSSSFVVGLQGRRDSNPQPPVLETGALPVELRPFATTRSDGRPLAGLLVRPVSAAPLAELPELDAIRGVPPALHGLVVPTLALFASHRHCDSLPCCHRSTTPVRGRAGKASTPLWPFTTRRAGGLQPEARGGPSEVSACGAPRDAGGPRGSARRRPRRGRRSAGARRRPAGGRARSAPAPRHPEHLRHRRVRSRRAAGAPSPSASRPSGPSGRGPAPRRP